MGLHTAVGAISVERAGPGPTGRDLELERCPPWGPHLRPPWGVVNGAQQCWLRLPLDTRVCPLGPLKPSLSNGSETGGPLIFWNLFRKKKLLKFYSIKNCSQISAQHVLILGLCRTRRATVLCESGLGTRPRGAEETAGDAGRRGAARAGVALRPGPLPPRASLSRTDGLGETKAECFWSEYLQSGRGGSACI